MEEALNWRRHLIEGSQLLDRNLSSVSFSSLASISIRFYLPIVQFLQISSRTNLSNLKRKYYGEDSRFLIHYCDGRVTNTRSRNNIIIRYGSKCRFKLSIKIKKHFISTGLTFAPKLNGWLETFFLSRPKSDVFIVWFNCHLVSHFNYPVS